MLRLSPVFSTCKGQFLCDLQGSSASARDSHVKFLQTEIPSHSRSGHQIFANLPKFAPFSESCRRPSNAVVPWRLSARSEQRLWYHGRLMVVDDKWMIVVYRLGSLGSFPWFLHMKDLKTIKSTPVDSRNVPGFLMILECRYQGVAFACCCTNWRQGWMRPKCCQKWSFMRIWAAPSRRRSCALFLLVGRRWF